MSKFKRVTSGLVGVAMAASMFTNKYFSEQREEQPTVKFGLLMQTSEGNET